MPSSSALTEVFPLLANLSSFEAILVIYNVKREWWFSWERKKNIVDMQENTGLYEKNRIIVTTYLNVFVMTMTREIEITLWKSINKPIINKRLGTL